MPHGVRYADLGNTLSVSHAISRANTTRGNYTKLLEEHLDILHDVSEEFKDVFHKIKGIVEGHFSK